MSEKLSSPWCELGISRASYYRKKKVRIPVVKTFKHAKFREQWIKWRDSGLGLRRWSATYKALQTLYLGKYFEHYPAISAGNLEAFLSDIPSASLSKRRHIYSAISSMARFLHGKGLISSEEYASIRSLYPRKDPYHNRIQRIIQKTQLDALLATASNAHNNYNALLNRTLLLFLSETGLRASEAAGLSIYDVQFSDEPQRAFVKVTGKGGKRRLVPFSKLAQAALQCYIAARPEVDSDMLFWAFNSRRGYTRLNKDCICRRFRKLAKATNIPFSAHSLRHYRITAWANNPRIPITVVQKWAGHSSLEVTQGYIHIADEDALRAAFE